MNENINMLQIIQLTLGPVRTNTYILADPATNQAAVIDPAWDGGLILAEVQARGWRLESIWFTHAHFDHIGGAGALAAGCTPPPTIALHPADSLLWRARGGAPLFGYRIDPGPAPSLALAHGMALRLGGGTLEVRHAPGHTPGHVLFSAPAEKLAFVGDIIFQGSIGRTDLPGGSFNELMTSIQEQVFSLPGETRLLCGHGPETTVAAERSENPFFS